MATRAPWKALLSDAGFHDVRVRTLSLTARFHADTLFPRANAMALAGMSAAGKAMNDHQRMRVVEAIVSESAPVLARYMDVSGGFAFELSTNLASGKG